MSIDKNTCEALRRSTVKIQRYYLGKDGEPNSKFNNRTGIILRHPNNNEAFIVTAKHNMFVDLNCSDPHNSVPIYKFYRWKSIPVTKINLKWSLHERYDIAVAKIRSPKHLICNGIPFDNISDCDFMRNEEIIPVNVMSYAKDEYNVVCRSGKTIECNETRFDSKKNIMAYDPQTPLFDGRRIC